MTMHRVTKLILIFVLVGHATVFAASEIGALLTTAYGDRARALLERYFSARDFQVIVSATPKADSITGTPYAPKVLTSDVMAGLTTEQLDAYVKSVSIEVLISKRILKSKTRIDQLLRKTLVLRPERGDTVRFADLGIEVDTDEWLKQRQALLEQSQRERQQLIDQTQREKSDLRQEVSILRSENDRMRRELNLPSPKKDLSTEPVASNIRPEDYEPVFSRVWRQHIAPMSRWWGFGLFIIATLSCGAFVYFGGGLSRSLRHVGGGLGTIGRAIEGLSGQSSDSTIKMPEHFTAHFDSKGLGGQAAASAARNLSPHHVEAYLIHLKTELLKDIGPDERRAVVEFINQFCQTIQQTEVSICILELLEAKDSKLIFDALGSFAQKQLATFISAGHFSRPKEEIMLEAAGELKTRILFQYYADPTAAAGVMVTQKLRVLTESELLEVIKRSPAQLTAYIMKQIQPDRAVNLFKRLKQVDIIRYEMVVRSLSQMSRIMGNSELDVQVEMLCDQVKSNGMDASDVGAFSWLESVINFSDSDIADEVFQSVAGDPTLGARLKSATVTVGLLWKLPFNFQVEILSQLSNRDLAVFISDLEPTEKNRLLGGLPAKRRAIIHEELQHSIDIKSELGRTAIRRAKEVIVGRLKALRAEGRLADVMDNARAA